LRTNGGSLRKALATGSNDFLFLERDASVHMAGLRSPGHHRK
jgi:hypothetical protein